MSHSAITPHSKVVEFPYHSLRNISCPEDEENGRKVIVGHAPFKSVLSLPTDENVRDYLLEAEGKLRRRPTQVHKAIQDTLENQPGNFSIYNGGITIVAREYEVDEKNKILRLIKPSIINGSQTQGVLKDFLNKKIEDGLEIPAIHIKYEVIITDDEGLIADTSIARNFQNDVMSISIAGRLGQLDELEEYLKKKDPNYKLRKSETKLSEDYVKTEKLLQVIAALTPEELWLKDGDSGNPNKVYTYSQKTKCLKDFQTIYKKAKDEKEPDHEKYKKLYEFYLEIAGEALDIYDKWKTHQGFYGTRIRALERDGRTIVEIPDGIIFPILASLSAFIKKTSKGWIYDPPKLFREKEIISAAATAYIEIARSNPQTMGKSKACYTALYQITSIYRRLSD